MLEETFLVFTLVLYPLNIYVQVELVLSQFKRAKGRVDAPDIGLYEDLISLYHKNNDGATNPDVIRRLAEKLQLTGIADLTQESLALHEMVVASGDPGESIEKMSMLLKKIKDFVQTENLDIASSREKCFSSSCSAQAITGGNHKSPVIPNDFRCPISLEIMKDPVIVSTGQVLTTPIPTHPHPKRASSTCFLLSPCKRFFPAQVCYC